MKRLICLATVFLLTACAPVLREDLMRQATLNPNLPALTQSPLLHEGKLFVLGGKIVGTRVGKDGSMIEAVALPVSGRGAIEEYDRSTGRFLALFPKDSGLLDPLIYKKDRLITIAGVFKGVRTERLDAVDYPYAFFEIAQIYLWEEEKPVHYAPYPPWWYDPWWGYPRHRYFW